MLNGASVRVAGRCPCKAGAGRVLTWVLTLLHSEQLVDIAQVKAIFGLRPKKLVTKCLLLLSGFSWLSPN